MENNTFMDKLRTFFGFRQGRQEPPRNDFRNPIWGSDDDDDGDELYTKQQIRPFNDPIDLHQEFVRQVQEMFNSFGSMFGDMKSFFNNDHFDAFAGITDTPAESDNFDSNSIRNYYLKPGYHNRKIQPKEDLDLDGKISSNEISGLLKQKEEDKGLAPVTRFSGNLVPGRSFCQTIITTSVKRPDGTVETRRIVKHGDEVIEETTTSTQPDTKGPMNPGLDPMATSGIIYSSVLSELSSLFRNFY